MKIEEYQKRAMALSVYGSGNPIVYPVLGINGEAGEVAEKVKKVLRDNNGVFDDDIKLEIIKELGDVLWYVTATARDLGYNLEDVMRINVEKLEKRREKNIIHGKGDNR